MNKRVNIIVSGGVQGVFFRVGIQKKARELSLTGWVRNEPTRSVKIVAEGEEENLKKLIDYCQKGTGFAKVDKVKVEWKEATGEFKGFVIKYN